MARNGTDAEVKYIDWDGAPFATRNEGLAAGLWVQLLWVHKTKVQLQGVAFSTLHSRLTMGNQPLYSLLGNNGSYPINPPLAIFLAR